MSSFGANILLLSIWRMIVLASCDCKISFSWDAWWLRDAKWLQDARWLQDVRGLNDCERSGCDDCVRRDDDLDACEMLNLNDNDCKQCGIHNHILAGSRHSCINARATQPWQSASSPTYISQPVSDCQPQCHPLAQLSVCWFVQYYGPDLHTTATNNNQQYSNSYLE